MIQQTLGFLARKGAGARRRLRTRRAHRATAQLPELQKAYDAFRRAHQISSNRQPLKGWDLWCLLSAHQPKFVAEMGSGTTSAVFALWAKRHNARYVAYEHHPQWAEVTIGSLRHAGLIDSATPPILVVPSELRPSGQATGFAAPIPRDADFVYIDGPPCRLDDGRKVPNDDIIRLFDAGARPSVIVVDGRWETVDLINGHPASKQYEWLPDHGYCHRIGMWGGMLSGREHTVFLLRS